MKTLANCNLKEFLMQTNKIRHKAADFYDIIGIADIRKTMPIMTGKETPEEAEKKRIEQGKKNISAIIDKCIDENIDATIEIIGLMCFKTPEEAEKMGIDMIPLCVTIGDMEGRDLAVDMDDFYGKIAKGGIPKSSQPPVGEYVEAFKAHAGKKILNIAMAHGLSGTYQSACGAKEIADNKDDIEVFNTQKIVKQLLGGK